MSVLCVTFHFLVLTACSSNSGMHFPVTLVTGRAAMHLYPCVCDLGSALTYQRIGLLQKPVWHSKTGLINTFIFFYQPLTSYYICVVLFVQRKMTTYDIKNRLRIGCVAHGLSFATPMSVCQLLPRHPLLLKSCNSCLFHCGVVEFFITSWSPCLP